MAVPLYVPHPTLTFATLFLSEDLGYLREHAPGVHLEPGNLDAYIATLEGTRPGIVPLLHMGLQAIARGARPKLLCVVFNQVVHRVVARPEIRTLEGLRGRLVMVNAFHGASDLETRFVLRKAGVRPEEVRFVEAGPGLETAQLEALREGRVDAIASSAPFWYVAEQEGFVVLGDAGTHYARWVPATLLVSSTLAAAEPRLLAGVRRSLERAAAFLDEHPQDALPLLLRRIPELTADAGRVLLPRLRGSWNPAINVDGLNTYIDAYCAEFGYARPALESLLWTAEN